MIKNFPVKKYVDDEDNKRLPKSGGTMTGNINVGNHKIVSNTDPTDDTHLARKKYVDDKVATGNFLLKSGGTMTGNLNMGSNKVILSATPSNNNDLTTKSYVDDNFVGVQKVTWLGVERSKKRDIYTDQKQVLTSKDPDYQDALSHKKYVDDRDNTRLPLSGGTMTGNITLGNNKIITTSDPTDDTRLTRKKYQNLEIA